VSFVVKFFLPQGTTRLVPPKREEFTKGTKHSRFGGTGLAHFAKPTALAVQDTQRTQRTQRTSRKGHKKKKYDRNDIIYKWNKNYFQKY
jgi:hypothetical protein